jgi:hypothetical protein
MPALKRRCLAARYVIPSFSAISGMVIPSITSLSGNIQKNLKKVSEKIQNLLAYYIFSDTI